MKKLILLFFLFCFKSSFSQTLPNFDEIKLDQQIDYQNAEPAVIQAAAYLLSTPAAKENMDRQKSLQFIIKWMSGTQDYTFTLDKKTSQLTNGNDELFGLYMTCMAKYCLENKSFAKNKKLVELNSIKLLLNYCENPKNNIEMTKKLKSLSEANKKDELEKEL